MESENPVVTRTLYITDHLSFHQKAEELQVRFLPESFMTKVANRYDHEYFLHPNDTQNQIYILVSLPGELK